MISGIHFRGKRSSPSQVFIPEEDESRAEVNYGIRHVISGLCIRHNVQSSGPTEFCVIGDLPTGGSSEEISVIEDIPTVIKITSYADSNNSFGDDLNTNFF